MKPEEQWEGVARFSEVGLVSARKNVGPAGGGHRAAGQVLPGRPRSRIRHLLEEASCLSESWIRIFSGLPEHVALPLGHLVNQSGGEWSQARADGGSTCW